MPGVTESYYPHFANPYRYLLPYENFEVLHLLSIMTKSSCLCILTILTFLGCNRNEVEVTNKQKFTFFELAYSNGWTNGPTFRVDSTGIFFIPKTMDLLQYGTLPDSIVSLIDNVLAKILQDTTIKSKDGSCEDCPLIAIIASVDDTKIRIIQSGQIDTSFLSIINKFEGFVEKQKLKTINATLVLESQKIVWPPPPPPRPLPKDLKFVIPRQESVGSR